MIEISSLNLPQHVAIEKLIQDTKYGTLSLEITVHDGFIAKINIEQKYTRKVQADFKKN